MDTQSLFSLAGRTALVTGGSRGIGKMIASGFIAQGAKVYISSRKADVCEAVADELGPNCIAVPQDIATVDGCKALAATMAEHESAVDILVNNAGAAWGESFETFPEAGWDKVMDLNVKSIFFLTQAMHGLLKAGASAEQPWAGIPYGSTKAGLDPTRLRLVAMLLRLGFDQTQVENLGGMPGPDDLGAWVQRM